MGDFNAQIGKRTNPKETALGKFGLGLRNIKKVQKHEYHVPKNADARPRQTDHTPGQAG